jgi:hypothetical protein
VLLLLLFASYLHCVLTDPGTVPQAWHDRIASDPQLAARYRLCHKSGLYRPPRSHYCSVTGRVVLNMDHFCPWVINTVGFYNRKFFVLFLIYTAASCCWVVLTSLPLLLELREPGAMRALERRIGPSKCAPTPHRGRRARAAAHYCARHTPRHAPTPRSALAVMFCSMAVILDFALIVMLSCFMPFHVRMVMLNETTIEGPSPEFHAGVLRNWRQVSMKAAGPIRGSRRRSRADADGAALACVRVCRASVRVQVMGKERWAWFLPIWAGGPDGDGVHWPSPMVKWANDAQADGYGTEDAASSSEGARRASGAHALEEGRLLASRCEDSSDGE